MVTPQPSESFRDLLLRFRGRSRLTQRQLAGRLGIHSRSVQQWEAGANYPSTERLEGLIRALLEAGGLTAGHEAAEAQALWAAVAREAPHAHAAFDPTWFVGVVAESPRSAGAPTVMSATSSAQPLERLNDRGAGERRQDWSDAPDTSGFVGRTNELVTLRRWILEEQCRLVAVLGMGGMGKTTLAARLAQEVATSFERVYWRSLR
ncbi:MAG: helix-turn-helix domain-containing protein, partial [Chloroflexi bacterium]|nr:helix-turn-helix domain-containing protein [Chloroflexota bacterium]